MRRLFEEGEWRDRRIDWLITATLLLAGVAVWLLGG
jgi:hypothetical protein